MQNDTQNDRNGGREGERHVAAVTAALSILDCFDDDISLRLRDIHERTGMQKSRILRLAGSLVASGYLVADTDAGGYRLGPRILALGQLAASSTGISERIRPVLAQLSAKLGETCFFSVVRDTQRMVLEHVSPSDGLCFTIPNGQLRPLHLGATGKVLLAFGSESLRRRILDSALSAMTTGTPADPASVRRDLEQARRQGYLTSRGEATSHAYALSVPVFEKGGPLLGALSVAGPSTKLSSAQEPKMAEELKSAIRAAGLSISAQQD